MWGKRELCESSSSPLQCGSRKEAGRHVVPGQESRGGSELELRQEEGKGYKSAGYWKWTQREVDLVMILDPQHRRLIRHAHQGSRLRQTRGERQCVEKDGDFLGLGPVSLKGLVVIKRQQEDPAERNWREGIEINDQVLKQPPVKEREIMKTFKDIMKSGSPKSNFCSSSHHISLRTYKHAYLKFVKSYMILHPHVF